MTNKIKILLFYALFNIDNMSNSLEKKKYLSELVSNQLRNIQPNRRLLHKDLCRITKYINSSIFDDDNCCIWNGYVTNTKKSSKCAYINFFFRNKKVALHRLLYENFVGALNDDNYLKFSCDDNKGRCCNINHMIKHTYSNNNSEIISEIHNDNDDRHIQNNDLVKNKIFIVFD